MARTEQINRPAGSDIINRMEPGWNEKPTETVANAKALSDLEFDRLRSTVRSFATSSLGEEAVDGLTPSADRSAIEAAIEEVSEAIAYLQSHDRFSLGAVRDLAPLLQRARENAFLDGEEFLVVLHTIEGTQQVRERLTAEGASPHLQQYASRLTAGGEGLRKRLLRVLDERGAVRDDASPELRALHAKSKTLGARVEKKLRSLIDGNAELISEAVITRRRGRLVVPIRSGAVGAKDFVVHDRSASGQTLYAEPTELVADNNRLAEVAGEIRDEVRRVLRELTADFLESEATFLRDRAILAHLDSLFARAGFAGAYRCAFPVLGHRFSLRHARHPLLDRERVVPISLSLGGDQRMVLITGPNTGGKTVSLKTLGLLSLMLQSGIPIPASPDSEFAIVSRVRTDIGDEQSIEQSLSTFSAHMSNLVRILSEADGNTLVLLDELGAGTDPEEGAALGLSMLEALLESGAYVASSTHLTPLKFFAIKHPEIQTASMEFDLGTLAPTFRVIEGIPGKSNAFIIAERLGLSSELVERARAFLSHGEIRAEDIIEELHRERQALEAHKHQANAARREMTKLKRQYERRLEAFESQKERDLNQRLRTLEEALLEGQRELEETLAAARKRDRRPDEAREDLKRISSAREALQQKRSEVEREADDGTLPETELRAGADVHVRTLDAPGRIVDIDSSGRVWVDLDGIRVATNAADLGRPKSGRERRREETRKAQTYRRPRPGHVPMQLNVRGKTVSEALREVEDYLDQLLRADIRSASILHGKGTGALQQAIHAYLASCSFVASHGYAPPNAGGEGVTVFDLGGSSNA